MNSITSHFDEVTCAEPQLFKNLTMIPLLKDTGIESDYFLLDEALQQNVFEVKEVSESGSVPELSVLNKSDKRILLLDGEELVGAKQNRILNITVMVPAKASITVPVSCVEAGRWGYRDAQSPRPSRSEFERMRARMNFDSAQRIHYSESRRRNHYRVSETLRSAGTRHGNQGGVWDDIARKSERMNARSETCASEAMYDKFRSDLNEYLSSFEAVPNQVGAVFSVAGSTTGVDVFESPEALSKSLSKLIQSYSLDAVDQLRSGVDETPDIDVDKFLKQIVSANCEVYDGVGEGNDYRIESEQLIGAALVVDERVIHLCAFAKFGDEDELSIGRSRMTRTSHRIRNRSRQA